MTPIARQLVRLAADVVKAPGDFASLIGQPTVFLAGAIDMGEAEDWQAKLTALVEDMDCTVLNPRRDDWDKSWKQDKTFKPFRQQVEWELDGMEKSDLIVVGLPAGSKAPISLMELGIHAHGGKVIVWCPKGYWRKGNVDIVCAKYHIPVFEDFDKFGKEMVYRLQDSKRAARVANAFLAEGRGQVTNEMQPEDGLYSPGEWLNSKVASGEVKLVFEPSKYEHGELAAYRLTAIVRGRMFRQEVPVDRVEEALENLVPSISELLE